MFAMRLGRGQANDQLKLTAIRSPSLKAFFLRQADHGPGGYDPVHGDSVLDPIGLEANTANPFGFWPNKIHPNQN